ncbi:MAG: aldehyde ferredoxin oxidoreductase C-terminal domain-containing protein [Promethearchaeota archaeon]
MKIVRINVRSDSIAEEQITRDSKYFLLGGRGLTSILINDEVNPKCDPLGEENKLIIANGILCGSSFPNSARTSIGAKSPLTLGIKESNVGGRGAMLLARHGIRALILEDRSPDLKIILIKDQGIIIKKTPELQGMGNYELHEHLRGIYGQNVGIYSIGPAGEHEMRSATISCNDLEGYPSRHAARGGLGAVMGSKNIKAIIIKPTKDSKVQINDIKKFKEVSKPFAQNLAKSKETFSIFGTSLNMRIISEVGGIPTKNFSLGSFDKIQKVSGETLHDLVIKRGGKKRLSCSPTCVIKCSNLFVDENGKHVTSSLEYETMTLNGPNLLIDDLDSLAKIDHYCDDVGIDTIEFGGTIGVAMDCGKLDWGDAETVINILDNEIRNNTETGKLYGNGVRNIGQKLNAKRVPQVKGQGLPAYDPRVLKAMGVTFATTPMGADHTAGAAIPKRVPRQNKDYGKLTENDFKLELSYELQIFTVLCDSFGLCYFIGPSYENMIIITEAINAMHGLNLNVDDVIDLGKQILKNEIEFNEKAGITQDQNDVPEFFKKEPLPPTNLTFTFKKEELRNFWKRLEK